ncbi:MAG TPA: DUF5938 domain-containing protein [Burkholderiaceae bacterium]|nr:DUF5938 domain-containing protein [Burkholderiaceae bacterium]
MAAGLDVRRRHPRPASDRAGGAVGRHAASGMAQAQPARGQRARPGRRVQPADHARVAQIAQMVEQKIKPLPPDQQRKALSEQAAAVQAGMPPRENQRTNRTLDSVWATGPNRAVHCVIHGARNYHQTGYLQAFAAHNLVRGRTRQVGFASACQAFGHREILGGLQSYGFVGDPIVTGHQQSIATGVFPGTIGRLAQ